MHESTNRCNGHIQVSGIGKAPNRHRDRKGCKKGKIEMIMKNSMGATAKAPKLQHHHQLATAKKSTLSKLFGGGAINNHHQLHVINSGSVIKNEIIDDPYTFTDSEPQSLGLYSATNCLSSTRKVQSVPSPNSAAAARKVQAATALAAAASVNTTAGSSVVSRNDAVGKSMRSVATSVDPMIAAAKTATISQLQPDIARNRVAVVKRRKVVPPAPPPPQPSHPPPPYLQHLLSLTNHQHQQEPTKSSPSSSSSSSQRHNPPPAAPPLARVSLPAKRLSRQTTWQRERRTRHELLQRIQEAQQQLHVEKRDLFPLGLELSDSEEDSDVEESAEVYQRHWFMDEVWGGGARGRESRLAQVNAELRRRLRQAWRGVGGAAAAEEPPPALVRAVVTAARSQPNATTLVLEPKLLASYSKQSRAKTAMLGRTGQCSLCARRALPCTRHCAAHIMYNVDQLLFAYCTAKLADHTQCRVPVFDVRHHMPLCPLHATNNTILTKPQPDTTPKRSRKRTKPSTLNRSRSKKKKKSKSSTTSTSTSTSTTAVNFVGESVGRVTADVVSSSTPTAEPPLAVTTLAPISNVDTSVTSMSGHDIADVFQTEMHSDVPQVEIEVQLDGEVPEEVLAIASMDPAELASQATKLLEDHEFTNMLLTPDFNDLFTDKNGQYEPTKEETEELERALEAVDKDVRSLERTLTSRTGLAALPLTALPLESLLDDATAPLLVAAPSLPPPPPYSHHFAAPPTNLTNS
ncbi:INO80 complex subunit D isoform X2 [Nilaparvata lugens]|uniref:INO80 complex subunit D isoform X2 n=1 Tax=Nilaparvata lugens TaxID=108931 RepID=UPI00193D2B18|nr:INO80 complex subunit D isoform X2 [Nilaparvata lugens]